MKVALWTKYGPPEVLELREVEAPVPQDDEVLIQVHTATVTAGDCEMRRFDLPAWIWLPVRLYMGIRKPRISSLGQELAGEIVAVGKDVTEFKPGDQVFADTGMSMGAYAGYRCLSVRRPIVIKPDSVSYEAVATIPTGGINAVHFLRKADVKAGEKVLINGAAGSIGTYAVQLATFYGAHVTAVDHTSKLDVLRSLGAHEVIDYTKEDFTKNKETYDVIIDIVGTGSFTRSVRSLNERGRYFLGNPRLSGMIRGLWTSMTTSKKVLFELAGFNRKDAAYLSGLMQEGTIKAVIDKRYPLEEIRKAHSYVEEGLKCGNVIINVS